MSSTIKNPVIEVKSTAIWKYLKKINTDFAYRVILFVQKISPLLSSIKNHFPYYTRHDAHHGYQVLERMTQIVDPSCLKKGNAKSFSAEETLLLICSAYGHDLGMTVFPNEEDSLLQSLKIEKNDFWHTHPVLQNYLRLNHSKRGGEYIAREYQNIGIPLSFVSHLDKLMMAHNFSINELDSQLNRTERFAAGSKEIDLKQLSCILCISDALEFSDTRVIEGVLKLLTEKIKDPGDNEALKSYYENMKHFCIGDNVAISKKDGRIIFSGTFSNPEILHLAHHTIDLIETWIRDYCDIDYNSAIQRLKIRCDSIIRTLSFPDDFVRIGVRIKKDNIISLISSTSTWLNDPALVIRELLQNSVEACRYRKYHSSPAIEYNPSIEVVFDNKRRIIRITDNGCGMSRNTILNNFLTVGNSRSLDPTYSSNKYHSLARFGIGFWSVFTIANQARIKSVPFEYVSPSRKDGKGLEFDVSIDNFKDYSVFKPIISNAGTSIELSLKDNISIDDIPIRLPYHICCSEIPITLRSNNEEFLLPLNIETPTLPDEFGLKTGLVKEYGFEQFNYKSDIEDIEFGLYIFYRKVERTTFLIPTGKMSVFQLKPLRHMSLSRVAVCGFLSNFGNRNYCYEIDHIGGYKVNNKNPEGISFTLNRNSIMDSPKSKLYSDHIFRQVHEGYRQFLKDTDSYSKEHIYCLNRESRTQNLHVGASNMSTDISILVKEFPELVVFKLFKIEKGKQVSTCDILYADLSTISSHEETVISLGSTLDFVPRNSASDLEFSMFYLFISNTGNFEGAYLIETFGEHKILEDYCKNAYLKEIVYTLGTGKSSVFINIINLKTVDLNHKSQQFIGVTRGSDWAGPIFEKTIEEPNFMLNHQHLVVKKDSPIATFVKNLFSEGQHFRLCRFINLLEQAKQGFVDESVKEYL